VIDVTFKRSIQDVLTSSADLLAEIKGEQSQIGYSIPNHTYHGVLVLAPNDYVWEDIVVNVYEGSFMHNPDSLDGCSVVIHGHRKEGWCNAFHYCHVQGYNPVGHEHPGFIKRWKEKWGYDV
jgi:hypothetical protein